MVGAPALDKLSRESPEDARTLLRYLLLIAGHDAVKDLERELVRVAPATEMVMGTVGERLIETGRVKGHAEGKAEGVLAVLSARGLAVSPEQRARVVACADLAVLDGWLRTAVTCSETAALFSH